MPLIIVFVGKDMAKRAMLQYYMTAGQLPFSIKKTAATDIIIKFMKLNFIIIVIQAAEFGLDKSLDWVWKAT